jgi:hypothetical protein
MKDDLRRPERTAFGENISAGFQTNNKAARRVVAVLAGRSTPAARRFPRERTMTTPSDFDSPWKDVLDLFFEPAMEFFFPEAHAQIDWSRGFEFLDKELQKITADAALGRRAVDKLVKVWLLSGEELWVLVHIEVQGQREADFELRIYIYNYRSFDRFNVPVASFVILTDEEETWRPEAHVRELLGTELRFKFPAAKLTDYAARLAELAKSRNPFSVIVEGHLLAQRTKGDPRGRFQQRLSLTKRLYQRGFDKPTIIGLYRFLDWVLRLPQELAAEFDTRLSEYEEEQKMPYVTTIERRGIEKGLQLGGARILLAMLQSRFGPLDEALQARIRALPVEQAEQLSVIQHTLSTPAELETWLDQHPAPPAPSPAPMDVAVNYDN